jgi:hypothetical protein
MARWLALDGEGRARAGRLCVRAGWWRLAAVPAVLVACLWLFRPLAWWEPGLVLETIVERTVSPPPGISKGVMPVYFWGRLINGGPRWYHAVMLAVTTPLPVLAAGAAGVVVLWRRRPSAARLLAVWIAVAAGRYAALARGNYDGVRHVLEAFPAFAVVAAVGADAALVHLARMLVPRMGAVTVWTLGTFLLLAPGVAGIARLHPYPVTYYNALGGGLAGAARWFETEYTGAVYREGLAWGVANVGERDLLWIDSPYSGRLIEIERQYLGYPPIPIRSVSALDAADHFTRTGGRVFYMRLFRGGPVERAPPGLRLGELPIVYEVQREGVPLLRIREVPASVLRVLAAPAP